MKTRIWKVLMVVHDCPDYDPNTGEPETYLRKVDLERELLAVGPQCYGLTVASMDVRLVGHIAAAPSSRRARKARSLEVVPHKARGGGKAKNGGAA